LHRGYPTRKEMSERERRNEIAAIYTDCSFKPGDFTFDQERLTLTFIGTEEKFIFGTLDKSANAIISYSMPGEAMLQTTDWAHNTQQTNDKFKSWCQGLRSYLYDADIHEQTPDLLLDASGPGSALRELVRNSEKSNPPIARGDIQRIEASLTELKRYIIEQSQLTDGQLEYLQDEITYLQDAKNRFGKKDFTNALLAFGINIVTNSMFAPDKLNELYQYIGNAFHYLFANILTLQQ
jgi:hypothetical protein